MIRPHGPHYVYWHAEKQPATGARLENMAANQPPGELGAYNRQSRRRM